MFERYTEKARRTVFFARYEASQFGSAYIETEHILLGLLREDWALVSHLLQNLKHEAVREELASHLPKAPSVPTSVDLPLSKEAKSVLSHAAEEAARLGDPHIGNEHMLLGLLQEPETYSAQLLYRSGARLTELRVQISKMANRSVTTYRRYPAPPPPSISDTVEIHGSQFDADHVR